MKIKKKEVLLPFRQTLAYRLLIITLLIGAFLYTVYEMVISIQTSNTLAFIIAAIAGVIVSIFIFMNLERLRAIKLPAQTVKRMKRR